MDKERQLYDKFVDVLSDRLDEDPSPKDLEVVMKFLQNNNIQATQQHKGLNTLITSKPAIPNIQEVIKHTLPLILKGNCE